jgi:hypothetical protein
MSVKVDEDQEDNSLGDSANSNSGRRNTLDFFDESNGDVNTDMLIGLCFLVEEESIFDKD